MIILHCSIISVNKIDLTEKHCLYINKIDVVKVNFLHIKTKYKNLFEKSAVFQH